MKGRTSSRQNQRWLRSSSGVLRRFSLTPASYKTDASGLRGRGLRRMGAMKTTAVTLEDLQGVFAVPPLARRPGAGRPLDLAENDRLVRHMSEGGLSRFLYGGNAFLYHADARGVRRARSTG